MTKKKILALCAAAILAVMAVAGTSLAYLVDTDAKENTFTVGNVDIRLIESSLHRENAGVANGATSTSELWSNVARKAPAIPTNTKPAIPSIPMNRSRPMPKPTSAKTKSSTPVSPTTRCRMLSTKAARLLTSVSA